MTRGQRVGELTRSELTARIEQAIPSAWSALPNSIQKKKSLSALLGHAIHYGLVSEREIKETTPRIESTLPCYLYTYVVDESLRQKIQQYVVTASKLYRRGSLILNLVAQSTCGPRLPGASDITVTVLRPRFTLDVNSNRMAPFRSMMTKLEGDAKSNILKHAFLPERWPTTQQPRSPEVDAVISDGVFSSVLPPAPADWLEVMKVTGWDNAINRMMSKMCGNLKVHATAQLPKAVRAYLGCVPMNPVTPRWLLIDCALGRPRPLIADNADWDMTFELRRILAGVPVNGKEDWHLKRLLHYNIPDKIDYSAEVLLLHFFLVRYGVKERTYLPVASRGRKYAYIDAKVATYLFSFRKRGQKRKSNAVEDDDSEQTVSVGELLGLTPEAFNRRRRQIRRAVRQRYRRKASNAEPESEHRRRLKKQAERWRRVGASEMPRSARIDSVETDGVGLRIVLKTPQDISKFVIPIGVNEPKLVRPKRGKKRPAASVHDGHGCLEQHPSGPGYPEPIMIAADLGRAKLFTAAVSRRGYQMPSTVVLTRRRYYYEMRHSRRLRWEETRMRNIPGLKNAVTALSLAGSLHNSDQASWLAYLKTETTHRQLLDDEFVSSVDRARWKMAMHRGKRRCLDNSVQRLLFTALDDTSENRPLILGIGNAGFPSHGPSGELPAPTSELSKAIKRGIERVRKTGRSVTVLTIDEFRTTLCCCACGSRTSAPVVTHRYRHRRTGERMTANGPSRRLRCCTTCSLTGKLRDRDVQASRNILWLTMAQYFGSPRPSYLCRDRRPNDGDVDHEH